MRALFCVLLAVGVLYARGGKKKDPVFDVPKPEAPSEQEAADRERGDALQRNLEWLAGWPSPRARRAAERLIVQKEKSLPLVEQILVSSDPRDERLKPGAGYVLGRIGNAEHVITLLLVAAEREQHRHASVYLEAALKLDRARAVEEAFRYFQLAETTLRREATKFVLNNVTKANYDQVLQLLDRHVAPRSFTREIGLRLLDRLVQSKEVEWEKKDGAGDEVGAGQYFYSALGDESPQVAARAMRLLAGREDQANSAELNRLITKEHSYWRQRSYAALALSLQSAAFKTQPLEAETIEVLRGPLGLDHPKETLARASAALALAQAALRTNDRELVRLLDKQIPILLIDSVGAGRQHYRDFSSVMPLAYAMLRRITGQSFPDHAPRWARWWKDHGRTFRAKRELIEVRPEDLPDVEIEVQWPASSGGQRMRLGVVGAQRPTFSHGEAYALPRQEIEKVVLYLRGDGFFTAAEADRSELDPDAALIVMRVGDLDRKVAYPAGEGLTARRDRLLKDADRLAAAYSWQRWWDIDTQPSWELFFVENQEWFDQHKDAAERADRLRVMVAGALNDLLSVEDRVGAARFVAKLPGGGGALGRKEVEAFVRAVASEREANEFIAAVVDLLVPAAGEQATGPLIDVLADLFGPNARTLLIRLCRALKVEQLTLLADDPRWKVRRAAVAALGASGAKDVEPVLEKLLTDKEILVRVEAATALARFKDKAAMATLNELAGSHLPEVRSDAAYALGLIGTEESRKAVEGLLFHDRNAEVRVRAIDGLVDGADPEGAILLVGVFRNENDIRVRAAAARAIVDLETPALVDKLIERLEFTDALDPERVALVNVLARFDSDKPVTILQRVLRGDDELSADAAGLGLARRWDVEALVQLIKMVRRGHNTRTAVRHLQLLTSLAFDSDSYKEQADRYAGFARASTGETPREWFRDALERRGYDVSSLKAWVEAEKLEPLPDEAVEVVLRALRERDWYIARNASFLLNRRIGEGAPRMIDYTSDAAETEKAIRQYYDWWEKEKAEKKAREQG